MSCFRILNFELLSLFKKLIGKVSRVALKIKPTLSVACPCLSYELWDEKAVSGRICNFKNERRNRCRRNLFYRLA